MGERRKRWWTVEATVLTKPCDGGDFIGSAAVFSLATE